MFPLVASISGMYYGVATRGISSSMPAGAFTINTGNFRHVVGVTIAGINETTTNITTVPDVFGRTVQTNTETINQLMPYAGSQLHFGLEEFPC